jgi:glutathione S-transferase
MDAELRLALLPEDLPAPVRQAMEGLPGGLLNGVAEMLGQGERVDLLTSLEELAGLVQNSSWLVGDAMSLADLAVAAQLSLLRFPVSAGAPLAGKGVLGLSDHPRLQPLFDWRDQFELALFQSD